MRRVLGRLLLAAFAIGQLQLVVAAVACVREHRQPASASHCADAPASGALAGIAPAHDAANPLCALLGPCAVPSPALAVPLMADRFLVAETDAAAPVQPSRPSSFDLTPPAPPPEA